MGPLPLTTTMGVYRWPEGMDDPECIEVEVSGTVTHIDGPDGEENVVTGLTYSAHWQPHLVLSDREEDDAKTALSDEADRIWAAMRESAEVAA